MLTDKTYQRWKYDIAIVLTSRGLLKMANGDELPPDAPGDDATEAAKAAYKKRFDAWLTKDAKAKEVVIRSLDDKHHDMIRSCLTAYEILKTIKTLHEQKTASNLFEAQRQYHDLCWTTGTTALEYVSRVKVVASKIEALGEKVSEAMLMAKILNDLPPEYEMLKEAWEVTAMSRGAVLKLDDLISQLIRHEKKLSQSQPSDEPTGDSSNEEYESADDEMPGTNMAYTASSRFYGNCRSCGQGGHKQEDCHRESTSGSEDSQATSCETDEDKQRATGAGLSVSNAY